MFLFNIAKGAYAYKDNTNGIQLVMCLTTACRFLSIFNTAVICIVVILNIIPIYSSLDIQKYSRLPLLHSPL